MARCSDRTLRSLASMGAYSVYFVCERNYTVNPSGIQRVQLERVWEFLWRSRRLFFRQRTRWMAGYQKDKLELIGVTQCNRPLYPAIDGSVRQYIQSELCFVNSRQRSKENLAMPVSKYWRNYRHFTCIILNRNTYLRVIVHFSIYFFLVLSSMSFSLVFACHKQNYNST